MVSLKEYDKTAVDAELQQYVMDNNLNGYLTKDNKLYKNGVTSASAVYENPYTDASASASTSSRLADYFL